MSLNSTISWSPPPISALNYSNCTATSAYFASSANLNSTNDVGYIATFDFLRSLVPSNWTDGDPKDGELLVWIESWNESTLDLVIDNTVNEIYNKCDRAICPFLQLDGDPDIAGIGVSLDAHFKRFLVSDTSTSKSKTTDCRHQMMASYYLVAFLATMYPIVIFSNSFAPFKAHKPWRTFHSWFEQTLNAFLDASLLFSISLLLAAIYRFSSASRNPDGDENTFIYSLINAVTVSMFAVFPPLILQSTARNLRRRGIRAILWFFVIVFVITVTILYYKWRGPDAILHFFNNESHLDDQINRHPGKAVWLIFCDLTDDNLVQALDRVIITAQVIFALNLPCWVYLVYNIRDDQHDSAALQGSASDDLHHNRSKALRRYGNIARGLNVLLCCAIMWLLLGTFTSIAVRLADAMRPWGKDRRWSIGQVLAMATFVPLLIDIVTIALYEPRKALEGKLPRSLRIVEAEKSEKVTNANNLGRLDFNNKRDPED